MSAQDCGDDDGSAELRHAAAVAVGRPAHGGTVLPGGHLGASQDDHASAACHEDGGTDEPAQDEGTSPKRTPWELVRQKMLRSRKRPGLLSVVLQTRHVIKAMRCVPELSGLSDAQLMLIARCGRKRKRRRYAVLYREGARADSFFVLISGTMQLRRFTPILWYGRVPSPLAQYSRGICH